MHPRVRGDYYAQVDNGDPFAPPVWRSPVYRTPESAIAAVQFARLAWRLIRFMARHPLLDAVAIALALAWVRWSWPGTVALAASAVLALTGLRVFRPSWFARLVTVPARCRWRRWHYGGAGKPC